MCKVYSLSLIHISLQAILEEVQEQMKGFADQFFGILDTNGVKVEDLKNGFRGIASYFNKLQSGKLDDSVRNVTAVSYTHLDVYKRQGKRLNIIAISFS